MLSCWFKAMKCLIRYFSVSLEYGTVMIVTKRMTNILLSCDALNSLIVTLRGHFIFLLTGLHIYMGESKAQGQTFGRALRGPRALDSPV